VLALSSMLLGERSKGPSPLRRWWPSGSSRRFPLSHGCRLPDWSRLRMMISISDYGRPSVLTISRGFGRNRIVTARGGAGGFLWWSARERPQIFGNQFVEFGRDHSASEV